MIMHPNLISGYRLENNTIDVTGTNNLTNSGCDYTASGKFGGAYVFSATDTMSAGDVFTFYGTGTTYCLWFKCDNITVDNYFFNKCNAGFTQAFYAGLTNPYLGQVDFTIETEISGTGATNKETMTISAGTWYFAAFTIDTAANNYRMRIYLDAVEKGTPINTGNPNTAGDPFLFGALDGGDGLIGTMDEMKNFNKVLPISDIKRVMLGMHPLC